jgi:hypothetical protein
MDELVIATHRRGSMGDEVIADTVSGDALFEQVTEATGLPQDLMSNELGRLLKKCGVSQSEMTLDDLRRVLADYVQDVLLSAKDEFAQPKASGE